MVPAKIGPLPTWAWGLVLLGGLGLGLYLRRHSSSSPTASIVGAGSPVDSLATGLGSDGTPSGVSTGMDPALAQMLSDSQSALVNESSILAGLSAQSVDAALQAAQGALSLGATVATTPPIIYTIGSSPAGSSPAGTSTPTAASTSPTPQAPKAPLAPTLTATALESKTVQKSLPGPTAVKATPNKTGVSANKGQGVISIH